MNKPKLPPTRIPNRIKPGSDFHTLFKQYELLRKLSKTLLDEPAK